MDWADVKWTEIPAEAWCQLLVLLSICIPEHSETKPARDLEEVRKEEKFRGGKNHLRRYLRH